jgi:hypothetical protein
MKKKEDEKGKQIINKISYLQYAASAAKQLSSTAATAPVQPDTSIQ